MKKALKIIGIILLSLLFIAAIVLYAIFPTQTQDVLTNIWAILNTPLPIVGVTTIAILFFVWQVIVRTNYGKQAIANIKEEYRAKQDELKVVTLGRGYAWLDTGTIDSLNEAAEFVKAVETRAGIAIAVLEEIAYHNNWITQEQLLESAKLYGKSPYGQYLQKIVDGKLK